MKDPKKPARWQLDGWMVLMLLLAVLLLRASVSDPWKTWVQVAWCLLTMSGMGVWVWLNRAALRQEDEQRRKQRNGSLPPRSEPAARTVPLTPTQRNFLRAMGQPANEPRAKHMHWRARRARPQRTSQAVRRHWQLRRRPHAVHAARAGAVHTASLARRRAATVLWFVSMAFTAVGTLVFLLLVGHGLAHSWSRLALMLYGAGGVLAVSAIRARFSWRLLVYPLVLAALIYLWDDTLPPPSLPEGYARIVLPLIVFGWMALDGLVRLRRVLHW